MLQVVTTAIVLSTAVLIAVVIVRQLVFTTVFWFQEKPQKPTIKGFVDLPTVTVVIPAYNEELVIGDCLSALRQSSYPKDRFEIVVINDRSTDGTRQIIDEHVSLDSRVRAIHRPENAQPGKPAALLDAFTSISSDIIVFFDADYLPTPGLVGKLTQPFADPSVGATMGRVVPYNTDRNILTRLIDLERRAGYVVDQEMRSRFGLLPQFGGTCGAVSVKALNSVGGWKADLLTEDTDLTYRLFLDGYRVAYLPDAMCFEESPETWQVRFRQVRRWAYGHNDCLLRYFFKVFSAKNQPILARVDAAIVLLFYFVPALSLATLVLAILVPEVVSNLGVAAIGIPTILAFTGLGNFSPYFQIAVGCLNDRQPFAFSAAPLIFLSSFISMMASTAGLLQLIRDRVFGLVPKWDKTLRFRKASGR